MIVSTMHGQANIKFDLNLLGNYNFHSVSTVLKEVARGGAFVLGTALQAGKSRDQLPMGSLGFFFGLIRVDSACNTNEYQGYLLGVKAAGE